MFHVVEHLPFDVLIDVLDEIARVLMPGGIAIFETPDPENVLTSTHYFYLDPTHRNPVPSLLLRAIVEARGLCDVDVMKLHPWPQMLRMSDSSEAGARLNEMFYGSQDYAVIGRKP
jgi:SAM-dependent methyltransferase